MKTQYQYLFLILISLDTWDLHYTVRHHHFLPLDTSKQDFVIKRKLTFKFFHQVYWYIYNFIRIFYRHIAIHLILLYPMPTNRIKITYLCIDIRIHRYGNVLDMSGNLFITCPQKNTIKMLIWNRKIVLPSFNKWSTVISCQSIQLNKYVIRDSNSH